MVKHLITTVIFIVVGMLILGIFISSNTAGNGWNYVDSDYAYTGYTNSSGANINSTAIVSLSRTVPVFTIQGRENQKSETLYVTVANLNTTNATINTVFNGVDLGNFTSVHETSTSNNYTVTCNSTLNTYNVSAYVNQKSGITLTSGVLTCSTSATGGYNLSGIIVACVIFLALFIYYGYYKYSSW